MKPTSPVAVEEIRSFSPNDAADLSEKTLVSLSTENKKQENDDVSARTVNLFESENETLNAADCLIQHKSLSGNCSALNIASPREDHSMTVRKFASASEPHLPNMSLSHFLQNDTKVSLIRSSSSGELDEADDTSIFNDVHFSFVTPKKRQILVNKNIEAPKLENLTVPINSEDRRFHLKLLAATLNLSEQQIVVAFDNFVSQFESKSHFVNYDLFASLLNLRTSQSLSNLFSLFDYAHLGRVDFKEFFLALSILLKPQLSDKIDFVKEQCKVNDGEKLSEFALINYIKAVQMVRTTDAKAFFRQVCVCKEGILSPSDFDELCLKYSLLFFPTYEQPAIILHEKLGFGSSSVKWKP